MGKIILEANKSEASCRVEGTGLEIKTMVKGLFRALNKERVTKMILMDALAEEIVADLTDDLGCDDCNDEKCSNSKMNRK